MSWTDADPGAGDCAAILVLSAELANVAQVAAEAKGQLQSLHRQLDGVNWSGTAADAFRDRIGKLPDHLAHLACSYQSAADGFRVYSAALQEIQDQVRAAKTQLASAQADHQLALARQQAYAPPLDPATGLPLTGAANPYDEHVAQAQTSIGKARSAIAALAEDRTAADAKIIAALHTAHKQGLKNASSWSHFFSAAGRDLSTWAGDGLHDLESAGQFLHGIGQYYWNNPDQLRRQLIDDGIVVLGVAGLAAGLGGEAFGVALDSTGAGAIAGVPVNIASDALIALSVSAIGGGIADGINTNSKAIESAEENMPASGHASPTTENGIPRDPAEAPPETTTAQGAEVVGPLPALSAARSQLEGKFKHAGDFGVTDPRGAAGYDAYARAVDTFVKESSTVRRPGTYRGNAAILNYNPRSGLVVVQQPNGAFVSGWKMTPAQLQNVITRGSLGGS